MVEPCEVPKNCNRNEILFKGFLSSWLAFTTLLAPYTAGPIIEKLKLTAQAAGKQCTGGSDGKHCGIQWFNPKWDGTDGLEQQMSTLSIFSNTLAAFPPQGHGANNQAPLTSSTGGNSTSNPSAGTGNADESPGPHFAPITTADRAGAGVLTFVFATGWIGMVAWMIMER